MVCRHPVIPLYPPWFLFDIVVNKRVTDEGVSDAKNIRSNPFDEIKCFEINRDVFGTTSAPFLDVRRLFHLGVECEQSQPKISNIIKNGIYVDDYLQVVIPWKN